MKRIYYKLLQFDRIINADRYQHELICICDIIQECDKSSRHQNLQKRQIKMTCLVNLLR